ncbi:MAG TPA: hypothetical protein VEY09_12115 [Pyrinomonadaceae bacterium]|nr:hypothetical protein [Pyrinomonadaceae bacterium]
MKIRIRLALLALMVAATAATFATDSDAVTHNVPGQFDACYSAFYGNGCNATATWVNGQYYTPPSNGSGCYQAFSMYADCTSDISLKEELAGRCDDARIIVAGCDAQFGGDPDRSDEYDTCRTASGIDFCQ